MKLKYSPIASNRETTIKVSKDTLTIDGTDYTFDAKSVVWPNINAQTGGAILEAHREDGEVCATVPRRYTGSWQAWYSPDYVEVKE
jgi:hypothetical protein